MAAFCFCLILQVANAQGVQTKIDSLLRTIYADSLPGISLAVIQNGNTIFEESYGVRNIATKEKITAKTNFNIASLTKQFTAVAILQLAEKKQLSLNDKLSRFFPDMNKKVADIITVQQLLTHTSGIQDHYNYVNTKGLQHAHNKDVYNAIKNVDSLYFTPGTKFRYSNTGFCLLALIIEKESGLSYNDYMQQNVFLKAGMKSTTIWSENQNILHPATGYDKDSATNRFITSGASEHIFFSTEGDGGVYTSIHDYSLWLQALNEGKILSKIWVEKAKTIEYTIDVKGKLGYGFGWFVDESKENKRVYHSGDNGGFKTYSFTIPQQRFSIVVFSNRSDINIEAIVQTIYHLFYPKERAFVPIEVLTS